MPRESNTDDLSISFEALAYSNAVTLQAVVQLLSEKGFLDWNEVIDRVQENERKPSMNDSA
jgi:hypothetical protein